MTIAYTTHTQDGKTTARTTHKGYEIEVNSAYDITADKFRFHAYVIKDSTRTEINSHQSFRSTLGEAMDGGVGAAVQWIDEAA